MATQRAIFFATALNMLASGADQNFHQMELTANDLSATIDGYHLPTPTTEQFQVNQIDHYAEQFIPTDCPDGFVPIVATANGNCLYNSISILLVGNESMASELRVRTSLVLLQLRDYFLTSDSQAVSDMIKEQILLYSPFAEHDYQLHASTVTKTELELVLQNEIQNTVTDKKWAGMWQIQALATSLDMAILSVYPMYNQRIRPLFNKLVTPLFHTNETIYILPVMWSGYMANNLFTANHFVPLVYNSCLNMPTVTTNSHNLTDCISVSAEETLQTQTHMSHRDQTEFSFIDLSQEQEPQTKKRKLQSNIEENTNSKPSFQRKINDPQTSYHCLNALPQYYCGICDILITTQKPKTHKIANNLVVTCSFCNRHTTKNHQSPLQTEKIYPGDIPNELTNLSSVEINLVSQIHPYMNLLKLPSGGQFAQRGQSISIPVPVQQLYNSLPRLNADDKPHILVSNPKNQSNTHIVDKDRVSQALQWLIKNNILYNDVAINMENICEKRPDISCENNLCEKLTDIPSKDIFCEKVTDIPSEDNFCEKVTDIPFEENLCEKVTDIPFEENFCEKVTDIPAEDNFYKKNTVIPSEDNYCDGQTHVSSEGTLHPSISENIQCQTGQFLLQTSSCEKSNEMQIEDTEICDAQNAKCDIQELSLIPTDYVIPLKDKKCISERIPKFTLPFFDGQPINIFQHKKAEELCFPHLFPYGKNGLKSLEFSITHHQYFSCRVLNKDKRWATNMQYLFWALNVYEQQTLQNSISIALRINPQSDGQLNAQSILSEQYSKHVQEDFRFMKQIKGTASYWRDQLYNLLAKINTLGPPTFFLSLSSNDFHWTEMYQFIDPKLSEFDINQLSSTAKNKMVRENPVMCAMYFSKRWETFLHTVLLGTAKPLGEITDYFSRIEFQNRGSPHVHCFLWVRDAPDMETIIGRTQAADFINKYISAQLPQEEGLLKTLVQSLQTHAHTHTCYKTKSKQTCRFDFPREVSANTQIQINNISNTTGRFYKLARNEDSIWINPYNPYLLVQWNANMDIQIVGCKYAAAAYVCTYVCKNEPESLKSALSDKIKKLPKNASIRKRLSKIGNILLTHRLISSQEAAFRLLNLQLVMSSRETIYINSAPESKRFKILKPKIALQGLPTDSTDIYAQSIHDVYSKRPQVDHFNNMCLAHFATHYVKLKANEKVETKSSLQRYRLLGKPVTYIREKKKESCFRTYTPKISTDPEGYFHSIMCLFLPWRKQEDILKPHSTYKEAFFKKQHLLDQHSLDKYNYSQKLISSIQQIRTLQDETQENIQCSMTPAFMSTQTNANTEPQPVKTLFTFKDATDNDGVLESSTYSSDDFKTLAQLQMTDTEYMNNLDSCTAQQKAVLSAVDKQLSLANDSKLHLFITGGGGCGKSFLLKLLREHLLRRNTNSFPNVLVGAPTGVAAYNVKGWTLHTLLQLNVQHKKQAQYTPLSGKQLTKMRTLFQNVDTIIIDEISMVSVNTLLHIHKRLTEIKDTGNQENCYFGGLNVIVFGDLYQLRPVCGKAIFKDHDEMCGYHLWRDLFQIVELTENVRQLNDPDYARILNRIRVGKHTIRDIKTLYSRKSNNAIANMQHIFPTKEQCKEYNDRQIHTLSSALNPAYDIVADDTPAQKDIPEDDSSCGGLPKNIKACLGARVMLLRNIETKTGLVNGAQGKIVKFHWPNGKYREYPTQRPVSIDVLFDDPSVGAVFTENSHRPVNIKPIAVSFFTPSHVTVTRTQFPLCVSFAVTIHKVQGLTLKEAAVYIGPEVFNAGMAYVALSRVTSLKGLTILDICPSKIYASKKVKAEMTRLRKEQKLSYE